MARRIFRITWATLLSANLVLWWALVFRGQVSMELAGPLVIGWALLFNFPSSLLPLWVFGTLAGTSSNPTLASGFEVALIAGSYGLGYLQWSLVVPRLLRLWKGESSSRSE